MSFPDSLPARASVPLAFLALIFTGAIFGFFYAWTVSTMWGLDAADPRIAIEAMQAMNASVRNWAFAPVFFGTPFLLLFTASAAMMLDRVAAWYFAVAGVIALAGGLVLTATVNVPLNETLAALPVPVERPQAESLWTEYSSHWQLGNQMRMVLSGIAMGITALGLWRLGRVYPFGRRNRGGRDHHIVSAARAGQA